MRKIFFNHIVQQGKELQTDKVKLVVKNASFIFTLTELNRA